MASVKFDTFSIDSLAFHNAIIAPAFADIATANGSDALNYNGTLNEFTLMDNVSSSRTIVEIRRAQNIMKRRDASCDIIYSKLFGGTTRKISVEEVYGATQFCRNEFYQGCLKDYRAGDPLFGNKIIPYFRQAMTTDLTTNSYFGDVNRLGAVTDAFSTTVYDGVFKWMKTFITAGVIPAGQTVAIADGTDYTATPTAAYTLIKALFDKQPQLMGQFTNEQKAFYVSREIANGYEDYMIAAGATTTAYIANVMNGIKTQLAYKGIPILVEPLWTPVITQIKGSAGYAAVLTIRGNFVFATDKTYGEGEDGKTALEVWYEKKDMTWYYRMFLKVGTGIALPEFIVVALSTFT